MPRSIHCSRLRLNIDDGQRWTSKLPRNCLFARLVFVFRLPRASHLAEHSTDQLPHPSPPFLVLPLFHYLLPPERPTKVEVAVDPSHLPPTPRFASCVAPVEINVAVTNGTQTARSVAVAFWVSRDLSTCIVNVMNYYNKLI